MIKKKNVYKKELFLEREFQTLNCVCTPIVRLNLFIIREYVDR